MKALMNDEFSGIRVCKSPVRYVELPRPAPYAGVTLEGEPASYQVPAADLLHLSNQEFQAVLNEHNEFNEKYLRQIYTDKGYGMMTFENAYKVEQYLQLKGLSFRLTGLEREVAEVMQLMKRADGRSPGGMKRKQAEELNLSPQKKAKQEICGDGDIICGFN